MNICAKQPLKQCAEIITPPVLSSSCRHRMSYSPSHWTLTHWFFLLQLSNSLFGILYHVIFMHVSLPLIVKHKFSVMWVLLWRGQNHRSVHVSRLTAYNDIKQKDWENKAYLSLNITKNNVYTFNMYSAQIWLFMDMKQICNASKHH